MMPNSGAMDTNDLLTSFIPPRKKRGRKSKAEKEAEARAATEAAVAASYHRIVGLDVDPDVRIPMICLEVSYSRLCCTVQCIFRQVSAGKIQVSFQLYAASNFATLIIYK